MSRLHVCRREAVHRGHSIAVGYMAIPWTHSNGSTSWIEAVWNNNKPHIRDGKKIKNPPPYHCDVGEVAVWCLDCDTLIVEDSKSPG